MTAMFDPESRLQPATIFLLRSVRACQPLFSNQILAELHYAGHTRGAFVVHPRTDGRWALVDERLPVGARTVATFDNSGAARAALERYAYEETNR